MLESVLVIQHNKVADYLKDRYTERQADKHGMGTGREIDRRTNKQINWQADGQTEQVNRQTDGDAETVTNVCLRQSCTLTPPPTPHHPPPGESAVTEVSTIDTTALIRRRHSWQRTYVGAVGRVKKCQSYRPLP